MNQGDINRIEGDPTKGIFQELIRDKTFIRIPAFSPGDLSLIIPIRDFKIPLLPGPELDYQQIF
jgi:hypothetical protein